jgi:hypothetical protein
LRLLAPKEFKDYVYNKGIDEGMSDRQANTEAFLARGIYDPAEDEIVLPSNVKTRTKFHEIGHKETRGIGVSDEFVGLVYSQPRDKEIRKAYRSAYSEILAEKYAWEKRGKPITYRIGLPAVSHLVWDGIDIDEAVDIVGSILSRVFNIRVPFSGKRELKNLFEGNYDKVF